MPRRATKHGSGKSHRKGGGLDHGQTVRFYGRHSFVSSAAANVITIPLNPISLDARLSAVSDEYQEFRFKSMSVRAWTPSATSTLGIAYTPVVPTTAPSAYLDLIGFDLYKTGNGLIGNPFPRVAISGRELAANGPKWFRRGTAYDDLLETQGAVYVSGTQTFSTTNVYVLFEYEVELKAQSEAALTVSNPLLDPTERKVADIASALSMVPSMVVAGDEDDGVLVPAEARTAVLAGSRPALSRLLSSSTPRQVARRV